MKRVAQQVKERPIIFSAEMVRAIVDGRKTQTRRVVKPPAPHGATGAGFIRSNGPSNGLWSWLSGDPKDSDTWDIVGDDFRGPYGVPGDRLWVRETHGFVDPAGCDDAVTYRSVEAPDGSARHVVYASTGDLHEWNIEDGDEYDERGRRRSCWRPSIHMPRWASRITLEVTGVRVERVQDIGDEDIQAEGVWHDGAYFRSVRHPVKGTCKCWGTAAEAFRNLWDSINAKRGHPWSSNPWVWVVEFERVNDIAGNLETSK